MKNWILAFFLALVAVAPIGYLLYHNTLGQKSTHMNHADYPMVQFESQNMSAMDPSTKHDVLACKVVDGYRFLVYLENKQHIEVHLPVATKPEATPVVVELLEKSTSPPPTLKLLRQVDDRYWIVEFTLTVGNDRKDLVELLRQKSLVL